MAELQALRLSRQDPLIERELNPFDKGEVSGSSPTLHMCSYLNRNQSGFDRIQSHTMDRTQNHTQLKLNFPTYGGEDPTGWIFKAEQYFEFKGIAPAQ